MSERFEKLLAMLAREPRDPFLLYGAAMELKKEKKYLEAIDYLNKTIASDPGYCYAYFQLGQVNEEAGDSEGAKKAYRDGIVAAEKKGDAHAREEIAGALMMID